MNAPALPADLAEGSPARIGEGADRLEDDRLLRGVGAFVDDRQLPGELHAVVLMSPVAHGRLRGIDASAALALPGVMGLVTAADIPGDPILATFVHDEPVLARDRVEHVGQVLALVVARDVLQARRAARL